MRSLHIIYCSSSGNTEYVIGTIMRALTASSDADDLVIETQRAERASAKDLQRGDVLLLACSTWKDKGIEGHLHPNMNALLAGRAKDIDLRGKYVACISLGDDRFYHTTDCVDRFRWFIQRHHGQEFLPPLLVQGDPYDQEDRIARWSDKLLSHILRHCMPARIRKKPIFLLFTAS